MSAPAIPASVGFGIGVAGVAALAVGVLVVVAWKNRDLINPVSDKNMFYGGANAIGEALTGDKDFSLGVKAFDAIDTVKGWFGFGEPDLSAPTKPRPNPLGAYPVAPAPLEEISPFMVGA